MAFPVEVMGWWGGGGSCRKGTVEGLCEGSSCCSHGSQLICRQLTEASQGLLSLACYRNNCKALIGVMTRQEYLIKASN